MKHCWMYRYNNSGNHMVSTSTTIWNESHCKTMVSFIVWFFGNVDGKWVISLQDSSKETLMLTVSILSERMRSYCIEYQRCRMGWICWVSGYCSRWQECFLSFPGLQVVLFQLCMIVIIVPDIILGLFVFVIAWVTWPQMCDGIGNSKCRVCAGRMHLCCIPFVQCGVCDESGCSKQEPRYTT